MTLTLLKREEREQFNYVFNIVYKPNSNCLIIRHGRSGWGSHTVSNRCLDKVHTIIQKP